MVLLTYFASVGLGGWPGWPNSQIISFPPSQSRKECRLGLGSVPGNVFIPGEIKLMQTNDNDDDVPDDDDDWDRHRGRGTGSGDCCDLVPTVVVVVGVGIGPAEIKDTHSQQTG